MDRKAFLKAFVVTFVFMLGFLTSNIYADLTTQNAVGASNTGSISNSNNPSINTPGNMNNPIVLGDNRTDEVPSPSSWITDKQIGVYSKNVILDVEDPQWAEFTDTHSMEPVISSRSYAIEVVPKSVDQINVGDIISYNSKYATGTIIHRVIQKSSDADGVYFTVKGDNNPTADPGKIRFDQIQRVVVAIIY